MNKKLFRSTSDKKLLGVLGGISQYFGIDSTIVRLAYALISIFSAGFPGLIIYIIAALVIPEEDDNINNYPQV